MKWIIGDIHGCYETMMALLEKIKSKDENPEIIFVGDFVDKGLKSKKVLEHIIPRLKSGEYKAVKGNHEELIYDGVYNPFISTWIQNGGQFTINSYKEKDIVDRTLIGEHINFLNKLPLYLIFEEENNKDLLVSHAFCSEYIDEFESLYGEGYSEEKIKAFEKEFGLIERCRIEENRDLFLWNRSLPDKENEKYMNITGHNITGHLIAKYGDIRGYDEKTEVIIDRDFGYVCIDTGAFIDDRYDANFGGKLTAISYPGLEIIQKENIDKVEIQNTKDMEN